MSGRGGGVCWRLGRTPRGCGAQTADSCLLLMVLRLAAQDQGRGRILRRARGWLPPPHSCGLCSLPRPMHPYLLWGRGHS